MIVTVCRLSFRPLAADYLRPDILKTFTPNLSIYVVVI
nr:MAG TPA: hypothetical protein [Caudoviricetes sp.]